MNSEIGTTIISKYDGECPQCEQGWVPGNVIGFVDNKLVCGSCHAEAIEENKETDKADKEDAIKLAHEAVDARRGIPKFHEQGKNESDKAYREFIAFRSKVLCEMRREALKRDLTDYYRYLAGDDGKFDGEEFKYLIE